MNQHVLKLNRKNSHFWCCQIIRIESPYAILTLRKLRAQRYWNSNWAVYIADVESENIEIIQEILTQLMLRANTYGRSLKNYLYWTCWDLKRIDIRIEIFTLVMCRTRNYWTSCRIINLADVESPKNIEILTEIFTMPMCELRGYSNSVWDIDIADVVNSIVLKVLTQYNKTTQCKAEMKLVSRLPASCWKTLLRYTAVRIQDQACRVASLCASTIGIRSNSMTGTFCSSETVLEN